MLQYDERFFLEVTLTILLPTAVGLAGAVWAGNAAKRHGLGPAKVRGIRLAFNVTWVSIAAAGITITFAPFNFLSALTASAIGGVAVSLALQTTLQNILAGYILLRPRFLRLGDEVHISGVTGTVVSLGLVTTVLKTGDGSLAFVSNSTMLSGPLLNPTAGKRLAGEY